MADKMTTLQELLQELAIKVDEDYTNQISKGAADGNWNWSKVLRLHADCKVILAKIEEASLIAERYKSEVSNG